MRKRKLVSKFWTEFGIWVLGFVPIAIAISVIFSILDSKTVVQPPTALTHQWASLSH
jgi:hypothetical protein